MTATLTTLVSFDGADGAEPVGDLIADAKGDLFGTTLSGGYGYGTVVEIENPGADRPHRSNNALTAQRVASRNGRNAEHVRR